MTGAERVAKRRAVLRAQRRRPRTFWLPDRDDAAFKERAQRDTAIINDMRREGDALAFVDAIRYWPEEYDGGPGGPP